MNRLLFLIGAASAAVTSFGQGSVYFANKVGNLVDAPVFSPFRVDFAPFYTVQLNLVNTSDGSVTPLLPTTVFQPNGGGNAAFGGQYWVPVAVEVPGVPPGQQATFIARTWLTRDGSWENTRNYGGGAQSDPFTITVGDRASPVNLTTLKSFSFSFVPPYPEPSTLALGIMGGVLLALFRGNMRGPGRKFR